MEQLSYHVDSRPGHRQWNCVSSFGFDETLERLKAKIAELELWVIHEINPQMLAERGGLRIRSARQLLFFHPRLLKQLLAVDPRALPEIPLKIVAIENADGAVVLRGPDTLEALSHYAGLEELANTLHSYLKEILGAVSESIQSLSTADPKPPFNLYSARLKVRMAENAWNSRNPQLCAKAYSEDSVWRNRSEFIKGRSAIESFLERKWQHELQYRLIKELWAYEERRLAVRFCYEYCTREGQWFRAYGNENWEFNDEGLMTRRIASINDVPISEHERLFRWEQGVRPENHPGLSELML